MIITVTMNPAMDKTVEITHLEPGGLNRISHMELDVGGKGINVSKTIQKLGGTTLASGFTGGNTGTYISNTLKDLQIKTDFINVLGETRTNTKVIEQNGTVTELNEPGPSVPAEKTEQLISKLESYAGKDTLFVLSGSIPQGISSHIYAEITNRVRSKGSKVFLDADGELFRNALKASPDIIKPNKVELEELFQLCNDATETELVAAGKKLLNQGVSFVAVSMGKDGALFLTAEKQIKCPGLTVDAHSTVGAGDAMVAAISYGIDSHLPVEEIIPLCVAASAGAVTTVGTKPPERELVDRLIKKVRMINVSE